MFNNTDIFKRDFEFGLTISSSRYSEIRRQIIRGAENLYDSKAILTIVARLASGYNEDDFATLKSLRKKINILRDSWAIFSKNRFPLRLEALSYILGEIADSLEAGRKDRLKALSIQLISILKISNNSVALEERDFKSPEHLNQYFFSLVKRLKVLNLGSMRPEEFHEIRLLLKQILTLYYWIDQMNDLRGTEPIMKNGIEQLIESMGDLHDEIVRISLVERRSYRDLTVIVDNKLWSEVQLLAGYFGVRFQ